MALQDFEWTLLVLKVAITVRVQYCWMDSFCKDAFVQPSRARTRIPAEEALHQGDAKSTEAEIIKQPSSVSVTRNPNRICMVYHPGKTFYFQPYRWSRHFRSHPSTWQETSIINPFVTSSLTGMRRRSLDGTHPKTDHTWKVGEPRNPNCAGGFNPTAWRTVTTDASEWLQLTK